jgi:hypothetical protein
MQRDRVPLAACAALALALASAPSGVTPASGGSFPADTTGARVALSWNAPPGEPRAATTLTTACGDTSAKDTLYVCLIPGRDLPTLLGFTAEVRFRPEPPDTLADYWHARRSTIRLRHFDVEAPTDSRMGEMCPFPDQRLWSWRTEVVPDGARARVLFGVPSKQARPLVAGHTYVLAMVLVDRPPAGDRACAQPLCVQWVSGTIALVHGYEPRLAIGDRFVGLRAPVDDVCATWQATRVKPWSLPSPKARRVR